MPCEGEGVDTSDGSEALTRTRSGRQTLRFGLGIVVAAGAVWLVVSAAGGVGDAIAALRQTNPGWIAPAIAFEAVAYLLAAGRFRRLAGPDAELSLVEAAEITLVAHGLGLLALAAPAEGIAFQYRELSHRGLNRRRIGSRLVSSSGSALGSSIWCTRSTCW